MLPITYWCSVRKANQREDCIPELRSAGFLGLQELMRGVCGPYNRMLIFLIKCSLPHTSFTARCEERPVSWVITVNPRWYLAPVCSNSKKRQNFQMFNEFGHQLSSCSWAWPDFPYTFHKVRKFAGSFSSQHLQGSCRHTDVSWLANPINTT